MKEIEYKLDGHSCAGDLPDAAYGPALSRCVEVVAGRFWVSNGEYASQVNYCPYCGVPAPVQAEVE